jgi:DNA polymerase-3 subunit gamma/tau
MDVLEIDAASNNGVDNVRDLRDDAIYSPSQVKMRVYIIDEVHMLSISAFNALLKIIEEPPEHLLFILATTELHKVPATILSRCQRFSFRRISQEDIAARLQYVSYQENIDLTDSAARVLARLADGGMRDGLSLLDQCASATQGELNPERVYACLGIAGIQECGKLMAAISKHDTAGALSLLNRFYAEGKELGALLDEMACLTRDFMVLKAAPKEGISLLSGVASDEETKALSDAFSAGELSRMLNLIQQTVAGFTRSSSRRMDAEMCIINLCQPELSLEAEALNARLSKLEEQIRAGVTLAPAASATPATEKKKEKPVPALKAEEVSAPKQEAPTEVPVGFWTEVATQIRQELTAPAVRGYFAPNPNAAVQGVLVGDRLELRCDNAFVLGFVNKPEILQLAARKASAVLGRPVQAVALDKNSAASDGMEHFVKLSQQHPDCIRIK